RLHVHPRQLREDEVDDVVLLVGLCDHLLRLLGAEVAHRGIEEVLLDGRVTLQLRGDVPGEIAPGARAPGGLDSCEQRLDAPVLLLQQLGRPGVAPVSVARAASCRPLRFHGASSRPAQTDASDLDEMSSQPARSKISSASLRWSRSSVWTEIRML